MFRKVFWVGVFVVWCLLLVVFVRSVSFGSGSVLVRVGDDLFVLGGSDCSVSVSPMAIGQSPGVERSDFWGVSRFRVLRPWFQGDEVCLCVDGFIYRVGFD